MASNLPSADVETLQAEVAEARSRLADTLHTLTAPETVTAAKNDMMQHVYGYKDQLLGGARESGEGFVAGMKRRAMANPLPLVLIGAGVAWRMYRHPPVATLLVGTGLALFMRAKTPPDLNAYRDPYRDRHPGPYVPGGVAGYGYPVEAQPPGTAVTERIGAAVSGAGEAASNAATQARDMATSAAAQASDMASSAAGQVSGMAGQAAAAVSDMAGRAASAASDTAHGVSATASQWANRAGDAASGAAERVGSLASGIGGGQGSATSAPRQPYETYSSERRWSAPSSSSFDDVAAGARRQATAIAELAQRNSVALGVIGIVAGAILGRALRASADTADYDEPRSWSRGSPPLRSGRSRRPARRSDLGRTRREVEDDGESYGRSTMETASGAAGSLTAAASQAAGVVGEQASELASSVADVAGRVASGAGAALSSASSTVARGGSAAYRTAAEQAAYAGRGAARIARRAPSEISDLAQRYPLLFGTVGLALGAALGGSMRLTESERAWMAPAGEALKERAREFAEEELGELTRVVERLGDTLQERVSSVAEPSRGVPVGGSEPATVIGGRPERPDGPSVGGPI